jgi:hypothetical protein
MISARCGLGDVQAGKGLMVFSSRNSLRILAAFIVAAIGLCLDIHTAYAQASSCSRLQSSLRQFDRNSDFRGREGNSQAARALQRQVQDAESAYVRNGCNNDARAGRTLTRECQGIARDVLRLREDFANVSNSVDTANAVAQQREAILQELARFGCGAERGSSANFSNERQGVFDRIFGTNSEANTSGNEVIEDNWGYQGASTVRTLCVRLSDGYFWPISYSTLPDMVVNDANQCHQSCPDMPVDLYYYDNPGQEPEQMRNLLGEPYSSMPNAFRYREVVDMKSTCKVTAPSGGAITLASLPDGQTRPMVDVGGVTFPMPLLDPRRRAAIPVAAPLQTATVLAVPLPRPRPAGPGEEPVARPVVQDAGTTDLRLVQFGDRVVRVVGPDTPYAQPVEAGS